MAEGDLVPNDQHVTRYCPNSQQEAGKALGAAFLLKTNEAELSVNWLEILHGPADRIAQLRAARDAMSANLTLKKNGWFAVLPVERISSLTEVAGTALALLVRHHPVQGNDGHSGIHGLPDVVNSALATATGTKLAQLVTEPLVQNRDL
jgi:hypothetical protein